MKDKIIYALFIVIIGALIWVIVVNCQLRDLRAEKQAEIAQLEHCIETCVHNNLKWYIVKPESTVVCYGKAGE